jgi:hypothetical protein
MEQALGAGAVTARPAPVPYTRQFGQTTAYSRATAQAATPRASRMLVVDYGYVVSELKRIGLTFGGLIILLLIIARLLG